MSNIQKIVRNGQIAIEILKIQFWTRFFWTTRYIESEKRASVIKYND